MSGLNPRRHSLSVLSNSALLSPPDIVPPKPPTRMPPWNLMVSEEDIPTFGKLKKIKKRDQRRNSTLDVHVVTEGKRGEAAQTDRRGRRNSVLGLSSLTDKHSKQPTNLSHSCLELTGSHTTKPKKKKTRRKLSFAEFLPFLFGDKARRRKSIGESSEDLEQDTPNRCRSNRVRWKGSPTSSTDSDSGCHANDLDSVHHTCNGEQRRKSLDSTTYRHLNSSGSLSDTVSQSERFNYKRHSVTFGCLGDIADLEHTESLNTILQKADWLSSQEELTNQLPEHCQQNPDEPSDQNISEEDHVFKSYDQVCHHSDCSDNNEGLPLILCTHCDNQVHIPPNDSHLRFDLDSKDKEDDASSRTRHTSSQSLPESSMPSEITVSDIDSDIKITTDQDEVDGSDVILNTKLHRKRVVKARRHPTEGSNKAPKPTMGHTRSHSFQEFITPDLRRTESSDSDRRLEHGDSGIVLNLGPEESIQTRKPCAIDTRRLCSVDSAPVGIQEPHSPAYIYSEKRNMPLLEHPSPTHSLFTPSPQDLKSGGSSAGLFINGATALNELESDQVTTSYKSCRDGGGPITKKAKIDVGSERPSPFTRKHSMPVMYNVKENKLNLGNVECFQIHFDIVEELTKDSDIELLPAIKGVTLREAVTSYMDKRGLHFDMVDFFIAASQSALQVDTADCYFLAGADLHVRAKQTADSAYSRTGSTISKSSNLAKSAEKKVMYLKRDQSVRQNSNTTGSTSSNGSVPPTTTSHRWSSLRPRSSIPNAIKNEPHPLGQAMPPGGVEIYLPLEEEVKTPKSELNLPESISPHGTLKGTQPLKGIGKLFGVTRKPDQLAEVLNSYQRDGLPAMPELLQLGQTKFDPQIFHLENSWTELVKDTKVCNRYQQEAIWEMLKTEVAYIRDLQLVINLFLACLYNLQSQALLNDVETEKIFSNIADLQQHNCLFYETHMYKIVTTARSTGQPLDPTPLIQGFLEFREFFEAYSRFCIDYMGCQQYLVRMKEENELFRMFLNWAENQRECNRLSLRDYIGKPFQRLTKYKLLLERIWREPRPDNVHAMISKVDQFICQVNATVTQLEIMRRIDSYDAVDLPNNDALAKMVGSFCRLDLTRPIHGTNRTRYLVEEGNLRMNNRTDVICFLFTDMLLITKATSKKPDLGSKVKVKVYRPPMRLDKIYVNSLNDGGFMLVYLNEYNLATTAYTFHGEHCKLWFERIRQTQEEYEKLRTVIMDQSEAYLLNLANGYEYEDEFAYMNARSVAMEMSMDRVGVNRQISVSSADTYAGSDARSEGRRPRSMTGSELDKMRVKSALSLPSQSSDRSPRGSPPCTPLVTHPTHSSRFQSPQDQPLLLDLDRNPNTSTAHKHIHPVRELQHKELLKQSLSSPINGASPKLPASVGQDELKKLKQRRDRRYFTADMIQDLHQGKDASIQKRLSWHSGVKDADYEYKQGMVKTKTVSTDSVRSVVSSSGVSSVSSLQHSADQDISEEGDVDWGQLSSEDSSSLASDTTTKTKLTTSQSDYSNSQRDSDLSTPTTEIHVTFTINKPDDSLRNNECVTQTLSNLSSQKKVSKSMPDISSLTLVDGSGESRHRSMTGDMSRDAQRRKLSENHSRRLKLQILNSTLEATDV